MLNNIPGPRRPRFHPGRQHLRLPPRATSSLSSLLRRIRRGMTTERDAWRVLSLVSRLDRAEGELRAMREGVGALREELRMLRGAVKSWLAEEEEWAAEKRKLYEENERLREQLHAWRRWERAWVFGGDAPWPGRSATADPREALWFLERLALGLEVDDD